MFSMLVSNLRISISLLRRVLWTSPLIFFISISLRARGLPGWFKVYHWFNCELGIPHLSIPCLEHPSFHMHIVLHASCHLEYFIQNSSINLLYNGLITLFLDLKSVVAEYCLVIVWMTWNKKEIIMDNIMWEWCWINLFRDTDSQVMDR